ncbi:MAG: pantoate--beta-alanine ligase [Bdellovibrionota bacterium]
MTPRVIRDLAEWRKLRSEWPGRTIGFVPTMGALHEGHASLLRRAREENEVVVLSIYVNPTQFNDPKDLEAYPATLDQDVAVATREGVDVVLTPTYPQIYPDGFRYRVTENQLANELEGAHRPGHFDGVLTVVLKLLNLVRPTRAYFGEKDHQQLSLVKGMAEAFFLETEIVPCATLRENDGLAMSSRNVKLSRDARELAPRFAAALFEAPTATEARMRLAKEGFEVDYVEDVANRRYGAVRIGGVRLIDNVTR